jgi:hypothetical protein
LQVSLENLPELLLDQVTLPVGTELEPRTFALQMVVKPTTTEEWPHDTVTLVPGRPLTVSVTGDDATVALAASFTWSSKLQFPAAVRFPVDTEGFEEGVHPVVKEPPKATKLVPVGDFSSHWQV